MGKFKLNLHTNNLWKNGMAILLLLGIAAGCKETDEDGKVDFDRGAMLENYANNLIVPAYEDFMESVDSLHDATVQFRSDPNLFHLSALRSQLLSTYRKWQTATVYEFGPASTNLFRISLSTFPANTEQIDSNIISGTYNLGTAANSAAVGLPALDYLLYGVGSTEQAVLNYYTDPTDSSLKMQYINDLVVLIKDKTDAVFNGWNDGYTSTFVEATGTDVGSSAGQLVNQFNLEYEKVKNARIGIPLGKKSFGLKFPEKTEAYYSGISAELALLNVRNLRRVFRGEDKSGSDGPGLKDYLDALNAEYNGQSLSEAIEDQFDVVLNKLQMLNDPLSETIINNPGPVDSAHTEIQRMVILIKTDMPSAMSILITYQDSDGD